MNAVNALRLEGLQAQPRSPRMIPGRNLGGERVTSAARRRVFRLSPFVFCLSPERSFPCCL